MWILDPEWAEQNGGGKKHRQNSKTSPFVFIFFPFAFRTTDEQQINVKKILAVINATYAVAKRKPEKSGLPASRIFRA